MPRTGIGRVFRRGEVWWIDYSFRGKRYRESSESTIRADATRLLKKRLAEMGAGHVTRNDERVTLNDLATILLNWQKVKGRRSIDRTELALSHLRSFFGNDSRALDITTDRTNAYTVARMQEGATPATIRRELAVLKTAFKLAIKAKRLVHAPHIEMPEGDNVREGFLDGDALEAVIAQLPTYLRPVTRFAAMTGWRKREVLGMRWADVDFRAGECRLEASRSKNKTARTFPFADLPPLRDLLEDQRAQTRAIEREEGRIITHVFHRDGNPIKSMRTAWDAACRRAGVPDAIFHDLRRTAVRNMERAGVSRSVSMKLSGHKTQAIFTRYAIAESVALAEGVAKLAKIARCTRAYRAVR